MRTLFQKEKTLNKVIDVPVEKILSNPAQPRLNFQGKELESLSESIRQNGILQPLSVRINRFGQYELIAGERRLKAAKLAKMASVPCIVVEATEQQSAVLALTENIQRQDLNFFEEARAIYNLMLEWNVTQEEAARRLGKAQSTLANKLRLLKLPPGQQEKILKGNLSERHARALLKLQNDDQREEALDMVLLKALNVSQTETLVMKLLQQKPESKRRFIPVIKDVRLFLNTINKAIDTMRKAGVAAEAEKIREEDCIQYIVKIPLHS